MLLTATDIYDLYRPNPCELRVFLKNAGEPEATPEHFHELLRELGERHEKAHLVELGSSEDVREGGFGARNAKTKELVGSGTTVIYQPVLMSQAPEGFWDHLIVGIPDLLLRQGDGYIIPLRPVLPPANSRGFRGLSPLGT